MGEVKRLFNQAKIERDVDARMLPPGTYRDALNVNVGESEGGDVGAVENLKGNEEIAGQTTIVGTTIGSVRDPNNDKVYWFNKGATTDAIYEYDEPNDSVSTILIDSVGRDKVKPQCAPELRPFLDLTPDDPNMRPNINIVFTPPVGGCTNTGAFNYNAAAEFDNGTCIPRVYGCMDPSASNYNSSANTADTCTYPPPPPPPNNITVSISGAGTFPDASSPVTLTASAGAATGTVSFLWSTGETTSSISVSGTGTTINGSVTATDDNGSATATYTVVFSTAAIVTHNLSASTGGGVTNSSVAGGIGSEQGIQGTPEPISFQSTITPSSGFQWSGTAPTFTVSGLPAGVTAGAVTGGTTGTNAASVTISGTWNPIADATITVTWTGGGIEAVPFVGDFIFSLPNGLPTSVVRGSTGNSFVLRITSNFAANGVQASAGMGAGGITTSPTNINGETFPNPSSLPIGDTDFTITFDVGANASHTEVTFNAVATNRDPFDGGQGPVNANCFTSEVAGSDANGVFHIPVVDAVSNLGVTITRNSATATPQPPASWAYCNYTITSDTGFFYTAVSGGGALFASVSPRTDDITYLVTYIPCDSQGNQVSGRTASLNFGFPDYSGGLQGGDNCPLPTYS